LPLDIVRQFKGGFRGIFDARFFYGIETAGSEYKHYENAYSEFYEKRVCVFHLFNFYSVISDGVSLVFFLGE